MPHHASPDPAARAARMIAARDAPLRGTMALADRLHSAAIHLLRRLRQQDAKLDAPVGPAGLSALSVLVFRGPQTVGQLADAERVAKPTMSRLVAALERFGMVTCQRGPSAQRVVRVTATDVGRSVMFRGREARVRTLAEMMDRLPAPERDQLGRAAELIERLLRRD